MFRIVHRPQGIPTPTLLLLVLLPVPLALRADHSPDEDEDSEGITPFDFFSQGGTATFAVEYADGRRASLDDPQVEGALSPSLEGAEPGWSSELGADPRERWRVWIGERPRTSTSWRSAVVGIR